MKFAEGSQVLEVLLQKAVLLIGEDLEVELVHHKKFWGRLISIFSREDETKSCHPFDVVFLRFKCANGERTIAHPDLLGIKRRDDV